MLNKVARRYLAIELALKHSDKSYSIEEIDYQLAFCDKDLFGKFRDGVITLDQLRARVAEKRGICKYQVYEDLEPQIPLAVKERMKQKHYSYYLLHDKNRPHGPFQEWEVNPHCLKSCKYKHINPT